MKLVFKILGIMLLIFIAFASYKKYQSDKERELIESIMDEHFQKEETELKINFVYREESFS